MKVRDQPQRWKNQWMRCILQCGHPSQRSGASKVGCNPKVNFQWDTLYFLATCKDSGPGGRWLHPDSSSVLIQESIFRIASHRLLIVFLKVHFCLVHLIDPPWWPTLRILYTTQDESWPPQSLATKLLPVVQADGNSLSCIWKSSILQTVYRPKLADATACHQRQSHDGRFWWIPYEMMHIHFHLANAAITAGI